MTMDVPKKQLSVEFRDLHFHSQPVLRDQVQLKLRVSMERGTGSFEVCRMRSERLFENLFNLNIF